MNRTKEKPAIRLVKEAPVTSQVIQPERPIRAPYDDELADELAERLGGDYLYFRGKWHIWTGGYWKQQKNIARTLKNFMIEKKPFGVKPTRNKATSIEWFLQADMEIEDETVIDQYPQYINMRNGLFNLDTLELEPHRREVLFTAQLDFDYDPNAVAPTFQKFLNTALVSKDGKTDWKLQMLFKQALGYTLTADTSRKVSFWLVGGSGTGKSTMISMIRDLLGAMHVTIDLNQLATNRFLLAQVAGKRALTFTEANVNSVLADGIYKALVGGEDEIQADVKNKEPITFKPQCKVWWAMNEMPRVLDRSEAVYGRVIIFPFHFTPPAHQRIPNLSRILRDERPGIFNLAIEALARLRSAGDFEQVEQVEQMREAYKLENDTEKAYVDERCNVGGHCFTQASVLYQDYKSWCEDNGFRPKNRNQVAKEWERLGFVKDERKDANYWIGVSVKNM